MSIPKELAKTLLKDAKYNLVPVHTALIAKFLNFEVKFVEFSKNMSEVISFSDLKERTIYVNNSCSGKTKLFAVAHELGHCLLHRDYVLDDSRYEVNTGKSSVSIENLEADEFASYLQIPRKFLKRYLPYSDIDLLSSVFVVEDYRILEAIKSLKK